MRAVARAAALLVLVAVAAQAQGPPGKEFLSNLMSGSPQLTTEQADALTGTWKKLRNSRLDGAQVDHALLAAVEAGNSTDVSGDFAGLVGGAFKDPVVTTFWLPSVDPQTGIYVAYFIIKNKDGKILDLQRWTGAALGQDDGSVLLSMTSSEDTAVMTNLMAPSGDRMVALIQEGFEVLQRNSTAAPEGLAAVMAGKPQVIDNQAVAVIEFIKLNGTEDEMVREDVIAELKQYWEGA